MALEIFKLVGSVFVDTDKANQSLQKTDEKASTFASTLGTVGKGALKFASIAGSAFMAVGSAAVVLSDKVAENADEIDKASIRMGISAESYQELAYAAGQCGVEMSTMEQAAKKLEGTDINFEDAIASIMELGTAEERSAKASELFGDKIAYNLSPLIEQSGEEFDGLIQRANDLGLVMSGDSVKSAVEFGDLLSDLKQSASALGNGLATALFPILIDIIKELLNFMPQIQGFIAQLTPMLTEIIASILPILFELLQALLPILMEIIEAILPLVVDLLDSLLPLIVSILPLLEPIAGLLLAIIVPLVQILQVLIPPLIDFMTKITNMIIPALNAAINWVAETVNQVLNGILSNIKPFFESIYSMFDGLIEFLTGVFTGNWEKAFEGIAKIAKSWVNMIISFINATINGFIKMINIIVDGALRLANLVPGIDIDTSVAKIPEVNIPMLAKGGTITEEGQAIVGERGAELLTLPKGARVEPLNNGFDYDKLANAIVDAIMQTKAMQDIIVYNQIGDQALQPLVVKALNDANYRSGGR